MNDIKMPKSQNEYEERMFGVLSPGRLYEYLDTNIYYVTQCISIRRHGYHALTVSLIINRFTVFINLSSKLITHINEL